MVTIKFLKFCFKTMELIKRPFAPVRYSGLGIQFRYSVLTVFPDIKYFQDMQKHSNTKTKAKRNILPQPII